MVSIEDILNVYGIDFKSIEGYDELDLYHQVLYEKFLVNIFNTFGLESRSTLKPLGIYFVEETQFLVKENFEDDYYVSSIVVERITRCGEKIMLHKWEDEEYKNLKTIKGEVTQYLRFEYEHHGCKEWLHVSKDGEEWY